MALLLAGRGARAELAARITFDDAADPLRCEPAATCSAQLANGAEVQRNGAEGMLAISNPLDSGAFQHAKLAISAF